MLPAVIVLVVAVPFPVLAINPLVPSPAIAVKSMSVACLLANSFVIFCELQVLTVSTAVSFSKAVFAIN